MLALPTDQSLGIAGLSGSGKTTFCQTIGEESKKRLVSLLPKAEYQYLFPNIMETNFSAIKMEEMPLVLFLGRSSISSNPRSTIGTHTGVFTEIRACLAEKYNLSPEVFSFNNELGWCPKCKGRGRTIMLNVKRVMVNVIIKKLCNIQLIYLINRIRISDINNLSVETILSLAEELHISEAETTYSQKYYQYEYRLLNIKSNNGYIIRWRINTTLLGGIHGSK